MSKRKIHFLGFLANVDDSILKLDFGDGFEVKRVSQQEIQSFMKTIDFYYGTNGSRDVINQGICPDLYCIKKDNVSEFEATPQGGVVIKWGELEKIHGELSNKVKLLRLFEEGNIILRFSFLYYSDESQPNVCSSIREGPLWSKSIFKLRNEKVVEVQEFINKTKIPFQNKFLQLSFDSFNLSYETHDQNLLFLSLMISMEAMLNLHRSEVTFQVSRNCAVLLGKDKKDSEQIFKDIKELYKKRSNIVHGSKVRNKNITKEDIINLRKYVRQSIKEINLIGVDKKELLDILNSCGFGQQPWRN